ncbi:MAG: phosphonate ABC transporter substrate-binding protein [Epulopiscium sp. Nele67-Bin002]|nr:MAG: phosphonate ABC transporter substrate-binding protein [Epulopiscium sp. Nuni2H_MBin001]OON92363.1 MAG: phosphonate ABC transporter substrate-binding protein [Epulopiscium sp. Nele67-Bin002]
MKIGKLERVGLILAVSAVIFTGCSSSQTAEATVDENGNIKIADLSVGFVPSRDPDEIVTATEPLKAMLQETLLDFGYDVGRIDITVGTNYEVVGEGLDAGTIDVGFIPGSTYVLYDDGADVILTATRSGLSTDSDDPAQWNLSEPIEASDDMTVSYRSLIVAGPSAKGQELAAKVNNGEQLTWDDLNSATWSVMSTTSPAGYIYPSIWLQQNYGKSILDLNNAVQADSYGSAFARLAAEQSDVVLIYADARRDNADKWEADFGRSGSIWDDTDVIGVTPAIYNDTVCVSARLDDNLAEAIQNALIQIGDTPQGQEVISIYNHAGYRIASPEDYDAERQAQDLIRQLNS